MGPGGVSLITPGHPQDTPGMGYETPNPEPRSPHPRTPHGNYRIVSCDNMGTKFNYCLFERCDILVSKYPESFVQIEKVVRKKINIHYSDRV